MCCDVLVTVEPHWFILRVACVTVWLQLVPITPSHLMISGSESAPSPHLHLITWPRLRTPSLVIVMLASAEARRRSYRTQETPGHTDTLSPMQSSEHTAEKCTCVQCSGNTAKNVLFSRKISPDISFCQQSCIALHYIFCFALGILID